MSTPKKVDTLRQALAKDLSVSKLYPRSHSSTGAMKKYQREKGEVVLPQTSGNPKVTPKANPNE